MTTASLQKAAAAAGTSIPGVVANLVLSLAHYDPDFPVAKDGSLETPYAACRVIKATEEKHFTLGVAYPAMKADVATAADGFRDFVTPDVLEKTAHRWLHEYRDVNLFHQEGTSGHFTPAESYIWPASDWVVDSPVDGQTVTVSKGDWMLGGYWDDYGWSLVKAGLVNGWSPEGGASRRTPSSELLAQLRR